MSGERERSTNKDVRDVADAMFVDVLMGIVKVKNPDFQIALERRIDELLAATAARAAR